MKFEFLNLFVYCSVFVGQKDIFWFSYISLHFLQLFKKVLIIQLLFSLCITNLTKSHKNKLLTNLAIKISGNDTLFL